MAHQLYTHLRGNALILVFVPLYGHMSFFPSGCLYYCLCAIYLEQFDYDYFCIVFFMLWMCFGNFCFCWGRGYWVLWGFYVLFFLLFCLICDLAPGEVCPSFLRTIFPLTPLFKDSNYTYIRPLEVVPQFTCSVLWWVLFCFVFCLFVLLCFGFNPHFSGV